MKNNFLICGITYFLVSSFVRLAESVPIAPAIVAHASIQKEAMPVGSTSLLALIQYQKAMPRGKLIADAKPTRKDRTSLREISPYSIANGKKITIGELPSPQIGIVKTYTCSRTNASPTRASTGLLLALILIALTMF